MNFSLTFKCVQCQARSAALLLLIICFLGHFEAAALKQLESTHTGLKGQIIFDIGSFHKYRYIRTGLDLPAHVYGSLKKISLTGYCVLKQQFFLFLGWNFRSAGWPVR